MQDLNIAKRITIIVLALVAAGCNSALESGKDQEPAEASAANQVLQEVVVEASCGQCQFGLPGGGCDLAVRLDGQAYFVDGANIDDHGDAHADDGLCNAVRKARVTGQVENGRFAATSFELLPVDKEKVEH